MMQNNSLAVRRVLTNTFVLYRSHLKTYLGITLRSALWSAGIFGVFLGFSVVGAVLFGVIQTMIQQGSLNPILGGLLFFVLGIGLLIGLLYCAFFCAGKSLMNLALISRLAYGELANKPQTPRAVRQEISGRHWQFFAAQFLVGLILTAVNIGLQVLQGLVLFPASSILGQESLMYGILNLVVALAIYGIYLWFCARLFIPEVPLAVEDNVTSSSAIERSWNLSKQNILPIFLTIVVAGLLTIPLYLALLVLVIAPVIPVIGVAVQSNDWSTLLTQTTVIFSLVSAFLRYIFLMIIIGFLITPFWQVIKGVIYYQLRSQETVID